MFHLTLHAAAAFAALGTVAAQAAPIQIDGPPGSSRFGQYVEVLPNGNVVVVDPFGGPVPGAGAVHLYDPDGNRISTLTGDSGGDNVGHNGIVVLANGDFVVVSAEWNQGSSFGLGAVTRVDGDTGLDGVVSAANSLTGTTSGDRVGGGGVYALANGGYVVCSPSWSRPGMPAVGAVVAIAGNGALTGPLVGANALTGTSVNARVGFDGVRLLADGDYVVVTPTFSNGDFVAIGAATFARADTPPVGEVSAANSLVGTSTSDSAFMDVVPLANGDYVVTMPRWDNGAIVDAGAVAWGDGENAVGGVVSAAIALVGTRSNARLGTTIVALTNGNYVVADPQWENAGAQSVGAVAWSSGSMGLTGTLSSANALVGLNAADDIGSGGVVALSDGNYVVSSPGWSDGTRFGAATWVNGATGLVGNVSPANSLVGGQFAVTALSDGHYAVRASSDGSGIGGSGAVAWRSGGAPQAGVFTTTGALTGRGLATARVTLLTNGNYVVYNPDFFDGTTGGALTLADANGGTSGVVSAANSILRASSGQGGTVVPLANGSFMFADHAWNGSRGLVMFVPGTGVQTGDVSASRAFTGASPQDQLGVVTDFGPPGLLALADGHFVVRANSYDFDANTPDSGVVALLRGDGRTSGTPSIENSVIPMQAFGSDMDYAYDATRARLAVGQPAANRVTLLQLPLFGNDFE